MPSKSKRKGSSRRPLVVSNGATDATDKTLDSYFSQTPLTDNNNEPSLQITSETVFYCHGASPEDVKNGVVHDIVSVGCLSTPEVSPEKLDQPIKGEPEIEQPIKSEPSQSLSDTSTEDSKDLAMRSSSHTSASSDSSTTLTDAKPKRRGTAGKVKSEPPKTQANHLLTDFFPVRKSSRKTAKKLQREHDELMRNLILDECEDGLEVKNYEGKGRGVEASKPFAKGDFVVEYAGDLVELKEAKFREEHYKKDISYGCYMYFFNHKGKSYCIDATRESGKLGRLLNHSRTKANCVTKTIDIGDRAHLILVAGRDIEVGEELVYDYGDRSKEAIESNPWLKD